MVPHAMINRDHCGKCGRPTVVSFAVEPEAAWTTVTLNRWRTLCPSCFDIEAHKARVQYTFKRLDAMSWNERPAPRNPYKRKHEDCANRPLLYSPPTKGRDRDAKETEKDAS